jgi:hypothetical protein
MEYYHMPGDETAEVVIGGGSYRGKEYKLNYNGRDVLYLLGGTSGVGCCCGSALGTCFITVPGFVKAWQHRTADGVPISEVEPVAGEDARKDIKKTLEEQHGIRNIRFW